MHRSCRPLKITRESNISAFVCRPMTIKNYKKICVTSLRIFSPLIVTDWRTFLDPRSLPPLEPDARHGRPLMGQGQQYDAADLVTTV